MADPDPNIEGEELPGVLGTVAAQVNLRAALKLAAAFGGTEVYVPERVDPDSPFAQHLGFDDAVAIAGVLGRGNIEIPMGPLATHARRRRDILRMLDGASGPEVARRLHIHIRTVRRHRNRREDERQATLDFAPPKPRG